MWLLAVSYGSVAVPHHAPAAESEPDAASSTTGEHLAASETTMRGPREMSKRLLSTAAAPSGKTKSVLPGLSCSESTGSLV